MSKKLNLYLPDESEIKLQIPVLESNYTKEKLVDEVAPVYMKISAGDIRFLSKDGSPASIPEFMVHKGRPRPFYSYNKADLAHILAIIRLDSRNGAVHSSLYDEKVEEVLDKMARQVLVGAKEINQIMGEDYISVSRWHSAVDMKRPFKNLLLYRDPDRYIYRDDHNICYLMLPETLRGSVIPKVYPLSVNEYTAEGIDAPAGWVERYSNRESAGVVMDMLGMLQKAGRLEPGKSKLLTSSVAKTVLPIIPMQVPQKWKNDECLGDWCAGMVLTAYMAWISTVPEKVRPESAALVLKDIYKRMDSLINLSTQLMQMMLPHISGLTPATVRDSYNREVVACMKLELSIAAKSGGEWYSAEHFRQRVFMDCDRDEAALLRMKSQGYGDSRLSRITTQSGLPVMPDMLYDKCGRPFVDAFLMFLAAFGYVEVGLRDVTPDGIDLPYIRGVNCFHITDLGRYAIGVENDVELLTGTMVQKIDVDKERLIIRIGKGPAIYNSWIESVARPIGAGRYLVTEESMLAKCATVAQIDEAEKYFRDSICSRPGKIWSDFFDGLRRKAKAVRHTDRKYRIFDIDKEDKELHRILMTDGRLKERTRRAEGCLLLVEYGFYNEFTRILKEYGYLV